MGPSERKELKRSHLRGSYDQNLLVSYKWLKQLVDGEPSEELAEKYQPGDRGRRCGTPAAGLSKIVVGEVLSCEDVPETHLHVCQVIGWRRSPSNRLWSTKCAAGIKVMVALPGARIATTTRLKRKIRGLGILGMICSLGELRDFWLCCTKRICRWHPNLPEMLFQGWSLLLRLGWWNHRTFHHQTVQMLFLCVGSARSSSDLWQGGQFQRLYVDWNRPSCSRCSFCQHWHRQGSLLCSSYLGQCNHRTKSTMVAKLLMNEGIRPINNVVDVPTISCFTLVNLCMPLTWIPLKELISVCVKRVLVKKLVTLDGEERELETSDLVITVADKPVALQVSWVESCRNLWKIYSCCPWSGCLQWQIDP